MDDQTKSIAGSTRLERPTRPYKASVRAHMLAAVRGGRVVIGDIDFNLKPGDALKVAGPNGAGKTTLLRALAGYVPLLDGMLYFKCGDLDVTPEDAQTYAVHYIGHADGSKPSLTVAENVQFWARLYEGHCDSESIEAAVARVGLSLASDALAATLSAGQRRRLALTRLLLSERPFWLLDEPTAALDAEGKALLSDLIAEHRANGGIVIYSGHDAFKPENTGDLRLIPVDEDVE